MSTESIAEIAEREAQAAEAESPESEAEPPDEVDALEPPDEVDALEPPPPTAEEIKKAQKSLDAEAARHGKRVAEIMREDFELMEPCPCCTIAGFVFPFMEQSPEDWERKAAVDAYFGSADPGYVTATDAKPCETCDALGQVLTGSKVENHKTKICPTCQGTGWTYIGRDAAPTVANGYPASPAVADMSPLMQPQGPDVWDRPAGHPDYGKPPAMVVGSGSVG